MTAFTRWLGVLLALPGMAAIVLPFYYGVSPMKVVMGVGGAASRTFAANYLWMAIPFFAAPMILDWQVRRARGMRMGWLRVFVWHATAVAAVAPVLVTIFREPSDTWAEASPALLPALAAIVVYGALVARCLGRKRPADETAGVATKDGKRAQLEARGWRVGDVATFLELTPEEAAFVETKLALSRNLRDRRTDKGLSQTALAKLLNSSQSRVAKMEAADPTVSVDLLLRALFALGARPRDVASCLAGRPVVAA